MLPDPEHVDRRDLCRDLRWVLVALALLGVAGVLFMVLTAWALSVMYQAADYPGAQMTSDNQITIWAPNPTLRRSTSYLSDDSFRAIYRFYSVGFDLGPEAHAESGCILMADSETTLGLIQQQMTVMLCDTPSGNAIFVMRAVSLRLP
jgi:hypothetical protein